MIDSRGSKVNKTTLIRGESFFLVFNLLFCGIVFTNLSLRKRQVHGTTLAICLRAMICCLPEDGVADCEILQSIAVQKPPRKYFRQKEQFMKFRDTDDKEEIFSNICLANLLE